VSHQPVSNGVEFGVTGTVTSLWQIAGGYSYQDGFVTSATTAARGAQVGQLPHHTFSLWNNYKFHPHVSAALGLIGRSDMFATIDKTVDLARLSARRRGTVHLVD